jgi:hypothetical protein
VTSFQEFCSQAERAAIQENATLKEMLDDAQRLHTFAIENCRQSEKESELAQHSIRLHVEREKVEFIVLVFVAVYIVILF